MYFQKKQLILYKSYILKEITEPALHTVRTASGSFFMANKKSLDIKDQLLLLKRRGLNFKDERQAEEWLSKVSYYRLKGYWWQMQDDFVNHHFASGWYFEDIIERYNFDRRLKIILFQAIESIEIAFRAKIINHMSKSHGGLWYMQTNLFDNKVFHQRSLFKLLEEFKNSNETFAKEFHSKYPNKLSNSQKGYQPSQYPDAWIILEIATLGELSKIYKNINHQLPEKSQIANDFGLNLHTELSSWIEAIVYMRNIIAHHSRLWARNMTIKPCYVINTRNTWLNKQLTTNEENRAFHIISCILYLCDTIGTGKQLRQKIYRLFKKYDSLPFTTIGFENRWQKEPMWKLSLTDKLKSHFCT